MGNAMPTSVLSLQVRDPTAKAENKLFTKGPIRLWVWGPQPRGREGSVIGSVVSPRPTCVVEKRDRCLRTSQGLGPPSPASSWAQLRCSKQSTDCVSDSLVALPVLPLATSLTWGPGLWAGLCSSPGLGVLIRNTRRQFLPRCLYSSNSALEPGRGVSLAFWYNSLSGSRTESPAPHLRRPAAVSGNPARSSPARFPQAPPGGALCPPKPAGL